MSSAPSTTIGPDLRAALVAMVRKRVPESEVEDIVQSTLADAIESPHAPSDSESLRRWIFGVAKNKVVDYHRRAVRETFEVPDLPGRPVPHAEADLLRWAEEHLPPGEENKKTLDWMLREGEGEKLEWIAESEKLPAPRVRQRVSRLRRHLKDHWQKEVALLATFGVLITAIALWLGRTKEPEPIANEDAPRAAEIRKQAFEKCLASETLPEAAAKDCIHKLDDAKRLDPAGDTSPEVRRARENAEKALTLPPPPAPAPTASTTPTRTDAPPLDSAAPRPVPSSFPSKSKDEADRKLSTPPPKPPSTAMPKPAPLPMKSTGAKNVGEKGASSFDTPPIGSKKKSAPTSKPRPVDTSWSGGSF